MAIRKKEWGSPVYVFGTAESFTATNGEDGADSSDIDLETGGWQGAHIVFERHSEGSELDDEGTTFSVFLSLDGTNYDELAVDAKYVNVNNVTDVQASYVLEDVAHAYIHLQQENTLLLNTAKISYKPWRWKT